MDMDTTIKGIPLKEEKIKDIITFRNGSEIKAL